MRINDHCVNPVWLLASARPQYSKPTVVHSFLGKWRNLFVFNYLQSLFDLLLVTQEREEVPQYLEVDGESTPFYSSSKFAILSKPQYMGWSVKSERFAA
ncbi:MAG: hypothetical protein AMXMBFR84_45710 [Candidatus Hydrogenedentota bacterium]